MTDSQIIEYLKNQEPTIYLITNSKLYYNKNVKEKHYSSLKKFNKFIQKIINKFFKTTFYGTKILGEKFSNAEYFEIVNRELKLLIGSAFSFTIDNYYMSNDVWHFVITDFFNSFINNDLQNKQIKFRINAEFYSVDSSDVISVVLQKETSSYENLKPYHMEILKNSSTVVRNYQN